MPSMNSEWRLQLDMASAFAPARLGLGGKHCAGAGARRERVEGLPGSKPVDTGTLQDVLLSVVNQPNPLMPSPTNECLVRNYFVQLT